jgi:hypothetical protein
VHNLNEDGQGSGLHVSARRAAVAEVVLQVRRLVSEELGERARKLVAESHIDDLESAAANEAAMPLGPAGSHDNFAPLGVEAPQSVGHVDRLDTPQHGLNRIE